VTLPDGKDADWAWEHGQDISVIAPGKFIQRINPEIVEIGAAIRGRISEISEGDASKMTVGYGFRSDELHELAGMMFGSLSPEDQCKMVEVRQTSNFPYQINGESASSDPQMWYRCR
jgi:hypothetical protein